MRKLVIGAKVGRGRITKTIPVPGVTLKPGDEVDLFAPYSIVGRDAFALTKTPSGEPAKLWWHEFKWIEGPPGHEEDDDE